jgi:hypothetical protein
LKLAASDFEAAAFFFRNTLDLIPTATPLEQSRCVIMLTTCEMKLVKNELDFMAGRVRKELDRLENPWPKHPYFGNGIKVPSIDGKPDKNIVERLGVGGSECDCCGKSASS